MILKPFYTTNSETIESGLIHYLIQTNKVNEFIQISGDDFQISDSSAIIEWGKQWQIDEGEGFPFLRFFFPNGGISLSKFAFRGYEGLCFSTILYLYGFSNDNIIFLAKESLNELCGEDRHCNSNETVLFNVNDTTSVFNSLLFTANNGSCSTHIHISGSGIEFFGTIFKTILNKTCQIQMPFIHLTILLFISIII